MVRWRMKPALQDDIVQRVANASVRIGAIYAGIGAANLVPYNAGGAQGAVTTLNFPANAQNGAYPTNKQMHSEMRALKFALTSNWNLTAAGQVAGVGGAITPATFSTDLPHCGYCTVMLHVLGLPFSTPPPPPVGPSRGRYNAAINLGYPVPEAVERSWSTLALLYAAAANPGLIAIKHVIDEFVNTPESAGWVLQVGASFVTNAAVLPIAPGGVLVKDITAIENKDVTVRNDTHFGTTSLRRMLWKVIFKALYQETG